MMTKVSANQVNAFINLTFSAPFWPLLLHLCDNSDIFLQDWEKVGERSCYCKNALFFGGSLNLSTGNQLG